MRIRLLAVFLIVIFLPLSFGLAQTAASLDSIPARMHDVIVANEVPGAVTVVAMRDSVLRMDAQGWADPERKSFMRVDSIFWIASMSKPITATAVLMLMEEGKLSLDDLIAKYIPELAGLKTANGKTPRITLRHLLTHTSGMGEATDEEAKAARAVRPGAGLCLKAACVRAGEQVEILSVRHSHSWPDRRNRFWYAV